ncbi:MAG TPA: hypothetical protein VLX29_05395 [Nitrospirota bacterium]|nr:hypothetical protein [Nitrospirota bacterium]
MTAFGINDHKTMKPSNAIRLTCRFCHGGARSIPECKSKSCSLNDISLTAMERIKRYCTECSADHEPAGCSGEFVGSQKIIIADLMCESVDNAICPLHSYRLGRNKKMTREGAVENLKPFHFRVATSLLNEKRGTRGNLVDRCPSREKRCKIWFGEKAQMLKTF